MSIPSRALSPVLTETFLHVLSGERLIPRLAARAGVARSTLHTRLVRLRRLGLVDWDEGGQGTLHATVAAVALTPCHGDPDAPDVEAVPDRDPRPDSGG